VRREEIRAAIERDPDAIVELIIGLMAEVEELKRRLGQNSENSSLPPSKDLPDARKVRRRQRSGRKPGGQSGHPGRSRELVKDPDRRLQHPPERCDGCGGDLAGGELVGEPVVHQVWELPAVVSTVTEHQRLRVRCSCCGRVTLAAVPDGVPAGAFGPNLSATIVGLSAHMSREQVARFVSDMFGCPITAASVEAVCKRASDALAEPCQELAQAVREQPVVHADETSWRWPAQTRWLWVATSEQIAVYLLASSRAATVAKELLGEQFGGMLVSDRYSGYAWIDPEHRQACWAHLARTFEGIGERDGRVGKLGRALRAATSQMLAADRAHKADGQLVAWCEPGMIEHHNQLLDLIERGSRIHDPKTSRLCDGLLAFWPALWHFTEIPDVDATNNRAERAIRFGVLLRNRTGGTRTDHGDRYIERLLTVRETCRLQARSFHRYLRDAITAALHHHAAPSLLPSGP